MLTSAMLRRLIFAVVALSLASLFAAEGSAVAQAFPTVSARVNYGF